MTPAEREALKESAKECKQMRDSGHWRASVSAEFIGRASPEVILHLLDLISTLELTLSNATRVGVVQMERIAALEKEIQSLHEYDAGESI